MAASPGQSRGDGIADDQAALRRVAVVAARAAPPGEVFAAVTEETGRLLGVGHVAMSRYDSDGAVRVVAAWSSTGAAVPVGTRVGVGGRNVHTLVFQTGRSARLDDYAGVSARPPISPASSASGRPSARRSASRAWLWGVMAVASAHEQPLPADTEARLAGFTELAATAIANAQARVELRGFAEEQAALRRVATLVARAAPPQEVFAEVTAEVGRVLSTDGTIMSRYEPEDAATVVGVWSDTGAAALAPVGSHSSSVGGIYTRWCSRPPGRPERTSPRPRARSPASSASWESARVGVPISVAGRLWGVMIVVSTRDQPLPGRHRGAAGRLHRAGRHCHRQRRGPSGSHRLAGADRGRRRPGAPGGSSATCTTEPSSGWSLLPCGCGSCRRTCHPGLASWLSSLRA